MIDGIGSVSTRTRHVYLRRRARYARHVAGGASSEARYARQPARCFRNSKPRVKANSDRDDSKNKVVRLEKPKNFHVDTFPIRSHLYAKETSVVPG